MIGWPRGDDDPHDRRPADTERRDATRDTRARLGAPTCFERPRPGTVGQTRAGVRSQDAPRSQVLLGAQRMWATPDSFVPSTPPPVCPPIGRSRTHTARRSFARATAPAVRARYNPSDGFDQQLQLTAGIRGGQARETRPTRTTQQQPKPVTSASTWGSSTIRVILVVITDRASPRAHDQLISEARGVSPGLPTPRFVEKSPEC